MTISRSRLGNRLARLLSDRGLSDGAFAAKVGLSRSRVNSIKNRRAVPTVVEALAIATALDLRVAEIFQLQPSAERARNAPCAAEPCRDARDPLATDPTRPFESESSDGTHTVASTIPSLPTHLPKTRTE